jgi:hypothetical protein
MAAFLTAEFVSWFSSKTARQVARFACAVESFLRLAAIRVSIVAATYVAYDMRYGARLMENARWYPRRRLEMLDAADAHFLNESTDMARDVLYR